MPEELDAKDAPFQSAESAKLTNELEQMYSEPAETPEADKAVPIPEFPADMKVSVLRTGGALDNDWQVLATTQDGYVTVIKEDEQGQALEKTIRADELAQMQHRFVPGQPVRVESSHGEAGWNVGLQDTNGEVVVIKAVDPELPDTPYYRKRIPAAELWQMEYGPRPEPTPAEKPNGLLGRFRRSK